MSEEKKILAIRKAILSRLKISKNPVRTADLHKMLKKTFKYDKTELYLILHGLVEEGLIIECPPLYPKDSLRWILASEMPVRVCVK